eukprot:3382755-Amphidinium_carterae.1
MLHTRKLDIAEDGMVVDMTYFDTGSENIITYATVHGSIIGWDLRSPAKELPATTVAHPTNARVRRLLAHPYEHSTVINAVQGNNEISFWE